MVEFDAGEFVLWFRFLVRFPCLFCLVALVVGLPACRTVLLFVRIVVAVVPFCVFVFFCGMLILSTKAQHKLQRSCVSEHGYKTPLPLFLVHLLQTNLCTYSSPRLKCWLSQRTQTQWKKYELASAFLLSSVVLLPSM